MNPHDEAPDGDTCSSSPSEEAIRRAAAFAIAAGTGDGYGTADVSPEGIDRSQLRRNLSLTPEERLEQMVSAVRVFTRLQGTARPRRC